MNTVKPRPFTQHTVLPGLAILCFIALLAMPVAVFAQQSAAQDNTHFAFNLGAHTWPALADLESSFEGAFDKVGFDIDMGIHLGDPQEDRWLWGIDFGLFFTQGDISGQVTSLDARGLYLVPSVKMPVGDKQRFYLDAGLGLYMVDFAELDCGSYSPCLEVNEAWQSTTLGGYIGASMDLPMGDGRYFLTTALRMHYANFGTPDGLGPSPGELNGPIFMFLIGIGM